MRRSKVVIIIAPRRMSTTASQKSNWFVCIENGDVMAIQNYLVSKNQDINELDQDTNETALHLACKNGQLPVVRILLRNSADINLQSWSTGQTALHYAIKARNTEIAVVLIERGADIHIPVHSTKETALHLASKLGETEIAELLVENQAKLNETTSNGDTALHLAVSEGHISIVRLLLSQQDDIMIDITNNSNMTAMDISCENGNLFLLQEIEQVSPGSLSDPILSIKNGNLNCALWLLEKGATVENPQKALKHLLLTHLFHPTNEYSSSNLNSSSHKRSRGTDSPFDTNSPAKRRKLESPVINLDEISSSEEDEQKQNSPLPTPFLSSPRTPTVTKQTNSVSSVFGVTLEQEGKLLALLLQQAQQNGTPICLDQHLETFVLPTLNYFQSSDPLRYQSSKQSLSIAGFVTNPKPSKPLSQSDPSDSEIFLENSDSQHSTPIQSPILHSKSILNGNYNDIEKAAKEMNLPIEKLQEYLHLLQLKKQMIFRGPPGTGKSFLARNLAKRLATEKNNWEMVQFHPNYAYEDFMMGFRPVSGQYKVGYELQDGPMVQMIKRAKDNPMDVFVMVVDEINRGNVCQVFGELFYLLEDRNGSIRLQYSSEKLQLPPNVYLLATMNTADRSIALLDDALMRRFNFVDLHDINNKDGVVYNVFKNWYMGLGRDPSVHVEILFDLLKKVNDLLDCEDKSVGPSYFMKMDMWPHENSTEPQREQSKMNMNLIWKFSVLPYVHNALAYDGGGARVATKLNECWTEFINSLFSENDAEETSASLGDSFHL